MNKYILEVYEPCDQHPAGHRWVHHHCDGTYDNISDLEKAVGEAIVDPCVLKVVVRMED